MDGKPGVDMGPQDGTEKGFFAANWGWFVGGAAVLGIAAVVIIVVRVKKKKRGQEQDE
jgi:hypothetical protein